MPIRGAVGHVENGEQTMVTFQGLDLAVNAGAVIDVMSAGREMDILIAGKVMGWEVIDLDEFLKRYPHRRLAVPTFYHGPWLYPPGWDVGKEFGEVGCEVQPFSTEIEYAWLVVELFRCGRQPQPNRDAVACVIEMMVSDACYKEDCYCARAGVASQSAQGDRFRSRPARIDR